MNYCFAHASGIDDVRDIMKMVIEGGAVGAYYTGTKMLMTAKTAKQLVKAFAKRTAGIVSVAWMVYDFGDCINSKK